MLASMATQPKIQTHLQPSTFPSQSLLRKPLKTPIFSIKPKPSCFHLKSLSTLKTPARLKLSAPKAQRTLPEEEKENETSTEKEKLGVVVKPIEKSRVVLKFIWMQKVIGIALNQVIPGHGTIPLSPYYFWPKEDAWEQLRLLLVGKPWISRKQLHDLLNQATDIIELWQDTGSNQ
ncbi:hypothetical protein POPTR_004G101000v4 [Populus trichocarpa]|uniref:Uncharacterized protein n=1 Tax=Populus trichocarpa TaxID=3694 RepID=A0ACC0T3Y1_POPTR|nr:30S ribosomal protein 3, chloroplastic [Populus trichocarpa]KAI9396256.1 hypothetical protein POPTR_004G101000v4 [Populus trichocarpa]